jgi:tellurite resistance protein
MIRLQPQTLAKLRDRLQERGQRPSLLLTGPEALERLDHPFAGDEEAIVQFEALVEAMFLMMAADGQLAAEEREVLKGAVRELTQNKLRSAQIEQLVEDCTARLAADGQAKRLAAITEVLAPEPIVAEAAFVLSAAMAFADSEIADAENDLLNEFAEKLGIDADRANGLLDELEDGA